jgi:hypothetical protein
MDRLMSVLYKYLSFKKRFHDSFSIEINWEIRVLRISSWAPPIWCAFTLARQTRPRLWRITPTYSIGVHAGTTEIYLDESYYLMYYIHYNHLHACIKIILQKCDVNSINKKYNYVDIDIEIVACLTENLLR